jgi:hypothetical protein
MTSPTFYPLLEGGDPSSLICRPLRGYKQEPNPGQRSRLRWADMLRPLRGEDVYNDGRKEPGLAPKRLRNNRGYANLSGLSRSLILLGVRSQTKQDFGSFTERFVGESVIGVFSQCADDESIDGLAVLATVNFSTLVLALEQFHRG